MRSMRIEESGQKAERVKIIAQSLMGQTVCLEDVDPSLTVLAVKGMIATQIQGAVANKIRLVCSGKALKNYQTISQILPKGEEELKCYVQLIRGGSAEIKPLSLRVATVMRSLAGKPHSTCVIWKDMDRDNALCFSLVQHGFILHEYRANNDNLSFDADNLMGDDDVIKHIKAKSLFDTALTVFTSSVRPPEESQRLFSFLKNEDTPNSVRLRVDPYLIPNTKLDCLSLVTKYLKLLEGHVRENKGSEKDLAAYRNILGPFLAAAHDQLSRVVLNNVVGEMIINTSTILAVCYEKSKNHSLAGVYIDEGVSALGLLAKIVDKLENFLSALSACGRKHWQSPESLEAADSNCQRMRK